MSKYNSRVDWECFELTDFQLPLNTSFASLSIISLYFIVISHHLYKLLGQHRVLSFSNSKISWHNIDLLQLINTLLDSLIWKVFIKDLGKILKCLNNSLPFNFPRTLLAVLLTSAIKSSNCCLASGHRERKRAFEQWLFKCKRNEKKKIFYW